MACEAEPEGVPDGAPEAAPDGLPDGAPEGVPDGLPEGLAPAAPGAGAGASVGPKAAYMPAAGDDVGVELHVARAAQLEDDLLHVAVLDRLAAALDHGGGVALATEHHGAAGRNGDLAGALGQA